MISPPTVEENPEQVLARHVVTWLQAQHWDVYEEVKINRWKHGIADIVAVREPLVWVIECKRSLTMAVLAQAFRWKALKRSIAVLRPATDRKSSCRDFSHRVCSEFGIGLIEVGRTGQVYETITAPITRGFRQESEWIRETVNEGHQRSAKAGSSRGGFWTPYKDTMRQVRVVVSNHPGCTLTDIMSYLDAHHYHTDAAARTCIARALDEWESWCVVDESESRPRYYYVEPEEAEGGDEGVFMPRPLLPERVTEDMPMTLFEEVERTTQSPSAMNPE